MQWGLIPEWAREFKMTLSTINARSEAIHASRLYKKLILQRRCIVPVSGFFEWKREGNRIVGSGVKHNTFNSSFRSIRLLDQNDGHLARQHHNQARHK